MMDIYERLEKVLDILEAHCADCKKEDIFQSKWCDCCAFNDLLEIVKRK